MDLLKGKLTLSSSFGSKTQKTICGENRLLDGAFERPRNGKNNDKAHPPIHPTSHANLEGDDKRVYDLVVRRFLACCSSNAKGMETTVEIEIVEEGFTAKGM